MIKKKKELSARAANATLFFCFVSFRHSSSSWKNSLRLSALSLSLARSHPARRSVFRGFRWPPVDGVEVVVVGATPRCSLTLAIVLSRRCLSFSRAHAKNVSVFVCLLCLALFVLLNLYLYFIFTKIYTNRLRIVINFN